MKKSTILSGFLITFLLLFNHLFAQDYDFDWVEQAGGIENDGGYGITVDDEGNTYITGRFKGEAYFGGITLISEGYYDLFIAKLDSDGNYIWAKRGGGDQDEEGVGIICRNGYIYVTGLFVGPAIFGSTTLNGFGDYDIFVIKMDLEGNFIWVKEAGGSDRDVGVGITTDTYGNVFVSGDFRGPASFGTTTLQGFGSRDIFYTKLDSNGNFIWTKEAGGSNTDQGKGIKIDNTGNVYITGFFESTALFGDTSLTSIGWDDFFIIKIASDGNLIWANQAGGDYCRGESVCIGPEDDIYVIGIFESTANFGNLSVIGSGDRNTFIVRIDTNGNYIWVKSIVGDYNYSSSIDGNSNSLVITGDFEPTAFFDEIEINSNGFSDIYISMIDKNGNFLWATNAGGIDYDIGWGIAMDLSDNIYSTGEFMENAIFGNNSVTSLGIADIFITKLSIPTAQGEVLVDQQELIVVNKEEGIYIDLYGEQKCDKIMIIDESGKIVYSMDKSSLPILINRYNLASGFYLVNVRTPRVSKTKTIILH